MTQPHPLGPAPPSRSCHSSGSAARTSPSAGLPDDSARRIPGVGPHFPQDDPLTTAPFPDQPAAAITGHLRALSDRIRQAQTADAADLLAGVLTEGGVLDGVRDLLDTAIGFLDEHAEATSQHDNRSVYTPWHILSATADLLDDQTPDLHRVPQLLSALTAPSLPVEGRPTTTPKTRRPQGWVPPAAIHETPAALEAITARLDAGTTPASAALLTAPVFDPDGGVLERLSELLASASRYAQQHGAQPELWQNLGRASQHLGDISETLDGAAASLAKLPATTGSAHGQGQGQGQGQGKSPGLPAPAASATAGRRR